MTPGSLLQRKRKTFRHRQRRYPSTDQDYLSLLRRGSLLLSIEIHDLKYFAHALDHLRVAGHGRDTAFEAVVGEFAGWLGLGLRCGREKELGVPEE
jgi:hypothetical protein